MGAWPCGQIVMVGELYGSESLSQVYGQIHTLLQEHTQELCGLGMWLMDSQMLLCIAAHNNASISTRVDIRRCTFHKLILIIVD